MSASRLSHRIFGFAATVTLMIAVGGATSQATDPPQPKLSAADYQNVLGNLDDEQAFQSFLDKLPRVETGGAIKRTYYVLDGDMRLTRNGVRAYFRQYVEDTKRPANGMLRAGEFGVELNVMTDDAGVMVKWPVGQRTLTYAVNRASFPSTEEYDFIVQALPEAVSAWTEACGCALTITHKPEFDATPDLSRVTFIVEFEPDEQRYLALGFYPSDPADQRYLYIMESYFTNTTYDKLGMLRHELGHILGYRHAHIGRVPGCEYYEETDTHWKNS